MRNRLYGAFDQIRADDALLKGTTDYLTGKMAKRESRRISKKVAALSVCMAAVFMMLGAFFHRHYSSAQTYVSIDANPSVEFALNGFDRVIVSRAYNGDGESLLNSVDIQGEKCDAALAALIKEMEHDGYIAADSLISVTVQTTNTEKEDALLRALRRTAQNLLTKNQNIEVYPVSHETWSNAHGCHMTPARYLAIQELMKVDETATLDQYSDSTIGQIRQRTQQCRNEHNGMKHGGDDATGDSNGGAGHGHGHHGGRAWRSA